VGEGESPGDESEDGAEESVKKTKTGVERTPQCPASAEAVSLSPLGKTLFSRSEGKAKPDIDSPPCSS
jgi:hypothetical protein